MVDLTDLGNLACLAKELEEYKEEKDIDEKRDKVWVTALQNWVFFFELAERYETIWFWEGSETQFLKQFENFGGPKLASFNTNSQNH